MRVSGVGFDSFSWWIPFFLLSLVLLYCGVWNQENEKDFIGLPPAIEPAEPRARMKGFR
jgi:hypothetical protein